MIDITLIGSGPSSLLTFLYLKTYYPSLKLNIITKDLGQFHCTYGLFLSQIENSWIYDIIKKKDLFLKTFPMEINCYGKKLDLPDQYGIINNKNLFNLIKEKLKDIEICLGQVNQISKSKNNYLIYYYQKKILYVIKSRFVIEATGFQNPIGFNYKYNIHFYKQVFLGYKLKIKHNYKKVVLLDWKQNIDNSNIKSFCYIIPLTEDILFMEETVLVCQDVNTNIYDILEKRLKERIKNKKYEILFIEKNIIPMNTSIPKSKSNSFGIGQVGNMMNIMSGYSVGYNIYHIPEYCKLIVESNFNIQKVYQNFWNLKRKIFFKINYGGLEMLNNLNQFETAEFQYHYFNQIVKKSFYQHKILFLNCDDNINLWVFLLSCRFYLNIPIKYLRKMIYYSIKNFF